MQGLPIDSDDDGKRHRRVAEEATQHGAVVERLAAATDRGGQHQALGIMVIHIDMGVLVVEPEAEAIAALDRQEGRDMEGLAAFQPRVGLDRAPVVVVDQIAVRLAERIVDRAQHGTERARAVAAEPETHRIEDVAQHAGHGHEDDIAVANLAKVMAVQDVPQPCLEVRTVASAVIGAAEGNQAPPVELQPAAGSAFQRVQAEAEIGDAIAERVGAWPQPPVDD